MSDVEPVIFVIDDDPSIRRSVARLLRLEGFNVTPLDSAQELLDSCGSIEHACIILDIAMPGLSGLELQEALASRGISVPIIFLTGRGDLHTGVHAMKRGAVDFLTKPVRGAKLLAAVRDALARDRAAALGRAEVARVRRQLALLTPREYEVFEHVVAGKLNKQTAAELGTAEGTIKVHRARVMEKLQVESVADLVRLAERVGVKGSPASP